MNLKVGDFELVFESGDDESLIESGFWMVISMDGNITKELKSWRDSSWLSKTDSRSKKRCRI